VPCWGTPALRHPYAHPYNTNCRSRTAAAFRRGFGVERFVKRKVMENGQEIEKEMHESCSAWLLSAGSEIKDGYP